MHDFKGREMDVGEAIEILVDIAKTETKRWGSSCSFRKEVKDKQFVYKQTTNAEVKQAVCIMEDFVRIAKSKK